MSLRFITLVTRKTWQPTGTWASLRSQRNRGLNTRKDSSSTLPQMKLKTGRNDPVKRLWMQNVRVNSRSVTTSDLRDAGKSLLAEAKCNR